jgi:tellurite resistance protein
MLILGRRAGARTGEGLTSLACRQCGGPLDESDTPACSYCGAPVEPGAAEWALDEVTTPAAAERARAAARAVDEAPPLDIPDLGDPRERLMLLWRMATLLAADGVVEPSERKLLARTARRWGVEMERLEPALKPGADLGPLGEVQPADRLPFLAALVQAALVDGRVDARERKLLDSVASSLGVERNAVDGLIQRRGRVAA